MIVITVARKPLIGSVVDNIVQWGTGGLNIDESRVEGPSGAGVWGTSNATVRDTRMFNGSPGMRDWKSEPHSKGRFPANIIFEHKPECRSLGVQEIKPLEGHRSNPVKVQSDGVIQFSKKPEGYQKISYTNENGMETVENWDCVNNCPVRQIDVQSGNRPGMPLGTGPKKYGGGGGFEGALNRQTHPGFGDSGGASRFFKQIQIEPNCDRASGECVCEDCGQIYYKHPVDGRFPFLNVLCNGDRVKL